MEAVTVSNNLSSRVQDSDGLTLRLDQGTDLGSPYGSFDGAGLLDEKVLGKILGTDDGNILGSTDELEERTEMGSPDGSFDGCRLLDGKVLVNILGYTDGIEERTNLGSTDASFNSLDDGI